MWLLYQNQISKSNHSLYSLNYNEACNEFARPISSSLRQGNTAPYEEMSRRWRAVGSCTVSDLTGTKFEPQASRTKDERVTAGPIVAYIIPLRTVPFLTNIFLIEYGF